MSAARREGSGVGWVVAQVPLCGLALLAPRIGPRWPRGLARPSRVAGASLLAAGAFLVARGAVDLGPNLTPLPTPRGDATLVQDGVYGVVRHPIYDGVVLGALGWSLLTANTTRLLLAGALLAFFDAKARYEEARLLARFPEYARYREAVARLLPGIY